MVETKKRGRQTSKVKKNVTLIASGTESLTPIRCSMCGKVSVNYQRDFYSSLNPVNSFFQLLPVCKSCSCLMFNTLLVQYKDEYLALKVWCFKMGIYYSQDLVDRIEDAHGEKLLAEYCRRVALQSFSKKTFQDTLEEEGYSFAPQKKEPEPKEDESQQLDEKHKGIYKKTIDLFGESFTDDELKYLQTQYADWVKRYECNEKSLEIMIKNIVLMDLDIRNATQRGEDVSKKISALSKAIIDANLKPVLSSIDEGDYSLGQYIEKWEDDKPIPVYDDPDFKDKDGILTYIQTWFFGHLSKVFGKHNSYSEMYEQEISKYTVEQPHYDGDEELNESVFGDND